MKTLLLKTLIYLVVLVAGFSVFSFFFHFLIATASLPEDEAEGVIFSSNLSHGTLYAWMGGAVAGLFYFWLETKARYLFLALPVLFPLGYCLYFTAVN